MTRFKTVLDVSLESTSGVAKPVDSGIRKLMLIMVWAHEGRPVSQLEMCHRACVPLDEGSRALGTLAEDGLVVREPVPSYGLSRWYLDKGELKRQGIEMVANKREARGRKP